jgi:hypothetical protein
MQEKTLEGDQEWMCGIPVSVGNSSLTFGNFAAPLFKKERILTCMISQSALQHQKDPKRIFRKEECAFLRMGLFIISLCEY